MFLAHNAFNYYVTAKPRAAPPPPSLDLFWDSRTIQWAGTFQRQDSIDNNWVKVANALRIWGIYEREVAAGVIGTMAVETAHSFEPVMEAYYLFGTPFNFDVAACDEYLRTHKPSWNYYPFYGRGFVQTTWESNYQAVQDKTGIPCVDDPNTLLQAWPAALALAIYFSDRPVLIQACRDHDWQEVRYRVLGGLESWETVATCAERLLAA